MQHTAQEAGQRVTAPKSNGRSKCILILLALSFALTVMMVIATGEYIDPADPFGTAHFIGYEVGRALTLFLISLLFFAIVRFMREAPVPTAGLGTGIVVMLVLSYLLYLAAVSP